jgi:hypothetical protein
MGFGTGATVLTEVLVRSGDDMYAATLNYPPSNGDTLHAESALMTLCPPLPAETPQPRMSPSVATAPQGWITGAPPPETPTRVRMSARWLRLGPQTHTVEYILLAQKTGTSEPHTLQEESDALLGTYQLTNVTILSDAATTLCEGQQGWENTERGDYVDGYSYIVESMVAFADDMWYGITYGRRAEDPEDPQARSTLDSLCPKV